jgi:ribosomal protein S2
MILSEIVKIGIPVMGLVNSHCTLEIDYPVFAQDQTISSVYFFCHFLATLIAKEMVYSQHKHYTLQKMQFQRKKKKNNFFRQVVKQGKFKKDTRKIDRLAFFFQSILPSKIRFQNQYALSKIKTIYSAKK